jgi:hypothetical protein
MTSISSDALRHVPARQPRRALRTRKKFLFVSIAALAALSTALGVSFTADSGVTTIALTPVAASQYVYPATYSTSATGLPTNVGDLTANHGWAYGKATTGYSTAPAWKSTAVGASYVNTGGDIAMIDARGVPTPSVVISVYVTNLGQLMADYSSFAFPVELYQGTIAGTSPFAVTWAKATGTSTTFLTDSGGVLSWKVPAGDAHTVYEVVMTGSIDTAPIAPAGLGGSYFLQSTTVTAGVAALSPSFYVTADEAA